MRPVERKFHRTARKLNSRNRTRGCSLIPRASMHHQKRQFLTLRESLELPAGLGYAVHFMVDARKKHHPWTALLHVKASDETTSVETASGGIPSHTVSSGKSGISPRLNISCIVRCTVEFSNSRMLDNICSRNAGGAFHSEESGRSRPPVPSR